MIDVMTLVWIFVALFLIYCFRGLISLVIIAILGVIATCIGFTFVFVHDFVENFNKKRRKK